VAGVTAAALAVGSFLLVRQSRLSDSVDRSLAQARLNLAFAQQNLPADPTTRDVDALFEFYRDGRFGTLVIANGQVFPSSLSIGSVHIPHDLAVLVEGGQLAYERLDVEGDPQLLVGGKVPGREVELYFFFGEGGLQRDLRQLGFILLGGWAVAVALAAVVGMFVARGTLGPVARASQAARSMAEGLLDTRLPVDTHDEFGQWAASFNQMAQALESKIAALQEARERERRFTSDVAHELRTPLAALVSEASLLREHIEGMPEDARRPAELIVGDVSRLRRLVDDLMEVSRLDAGSATVRLEPFDLAEVTEACIRARGWASTVAMRTDPAAVLSDRRRVERVVANLVGNAVEHGMRHVEVRVGHDASGAFVEVSDRGSGIGLDHLPHLFERFYKADPARTGPGSGLGLAIALENARLLGGDIRVWSEPGRGSKFTLLLPVSEPLREGDGPVASGSDDERVSDEEVGT
jgi:two-component system sensor histidine kinase MtrB